MKKQRRSILVLAVMVVFIAAGLFLPSLSGAGNLEPSAGPDDDTSAMYTIEDLYDYLDTGVAGTRRTGGFVEPVSDPGSTGRTLDEVHARITEKCITCEGSLTGTRWCDQGNGTVKDMTTGLVWLKDANWGGWKSWRQSGDSTQNDDAHTRAGILYAGASGAGLSDGSVVGDWRLPTKTELFNLAHGTEAVRSGNMRAFTGLQSRYYWSSTTDASYTSNAWYANMGNGSVRSIHKGNYPFVWPVRSDN